MCTTSAVENLLKRVSEHKDQCTGTFSIADSLCFQHVATHKFHCSAGHDMDWASSPHVEGGDFLANLRMAHGYLSSGMLPNQYERFCKSAGIGVMGDKYLNGIQTTYSKTIQDLATKSMNDAVNEEIAHSECIRKDSDDHGISVMCDARHCWRKNAQFSDIVCLGEETRKVLRIETINKYTEESCSQKHETLGVTKILKHFDDEQVPIINFIHDDNRSVSKVLREQAPDICDNKDTWHATKGIARNIRKLTSGTKANKFKTWHPELSDKAASIKTHIYWAMKECGGDADKLRSDILNLVFHYKGIHDSCHKGARCQVDGKDYEPSKTLLQDPKAELMLTNFLKSCKVYKEAENYKNCKNTHYVESFNNSALQYVDKRIAFGEASYKLRINLSIMDWNEHVGRPVTSTSTVIDIRRPRKKSARPVHTRKTYAFRDTIWNTWIESFYSD
jgi:hypothetical protein